MARYSATWFTVTAATLADTTAATNATYPGTLRGGGTTTLAKVNEISISGEDTASLVDTFVFGRASVVSVGALSVGNNALLDVQATAPGTVMSWGNTAATSGPGRAPTLYLLMPVLNTFGGIYRWQARYGEEISVYGNAANVGEASITSKTGSGKTSGHMLYELC
jgi:hypothetical protein